MPRISNSIINLMINGIKLLEPRLKGLYNPLYKETNTQTYFGENRCGEACFILKYILERKNYRVNMFKVENNMNKLCNDHIFLKVNDKIVDPTYKQFLQSDYSRNSDCRYVNKMQLDLFPIFIGDKKELIQMIAKLNNVHNTIYAKELVVYDYWQETNEFKLNIDLFKCINNKEYLLMQDDFYKDFTMKFKTLLE